MISRQDFFENYGTKLPNFRQKQVNVLLFDPSKSSYSEASNLPKDLVAALTESCGFFSIEKVKILKSKIDGTYKGLFRADTRLVSMYPPQIALYVVLRLVYSEEL